MIVSSNVSLINNFITFVSHSNIPHVISDCQLLTVSRVRGEVEGSQGCAGDDGKTERPTTRQEIGLCGEERDLESIIRF